MIDTHINGVRVTVEKIKQFIASPIGIFLYAFCTGAIGIIILLAFLAMVLSPSALPMALPVIIAFNCAAGGYSIAEKSSTEGSAKMQLGILPLLLTLTGCVALVFFCPWEPFFTINRYLISTILALMCTFFGAWIARKSKSLNR